MASYMVNTDLAQYSMQLESYSISAFHCLYYDVVDQLTSDTTYMSIDTFPLHSISLMIFGWLITCMLQDKVIL